MARGIGSAQSNVLRASICALVSTLSAPAWSDEIVAVLERSQAARLASLQVVAIGDSERATIVRRSFDALTSQLQRNPDLDVRIVTGPAIAELLGHVVVANESLADLQEPIRLFILAHEIGHAALGHRQQMTQLYAKHLPGQLEQANLATANAALLPEASRLSRTHELEADAFAYAALRALGYTLVDVVGALTAFGMQQDTATHPGTGKRIAHLRSLG